MVLVMGLVMSIALRIAVGIIALHRDYSTRYKTTLALTRRAEAIFKPYCTLIYLFSRLNGVHLQLSDRKNQLHNFQQR